MNGILDSSQRRRQGLNPLTTSINQAQPAYQSSPSIVGLSSPFHQTATYTPASAVSVRQYNPQQWGGQAGVGTEVAGRYSPVTLSDEVVTPAPPPYSPPRNQRSTITSPEERLSAVSPFSHTSPLVMQRSSLEQPSSQAFPPPPGFSTRALSRERPAALFGLGVFTRKSGTPDGIDAASASSDVNRDYGSSSRRPLQIAIEPIQVERNTIVDEGPPASRRAVSTSAIGTPSSSRSRGSSTSRWEPGMPLPPPPPGPPPAPSSRSQSMTRASDSITSPPTRRPHGISSLGPVPPTPAGWADGQDMPRGNSRGRSPNPGLHIDTSSVGSSTAPESNSGSSSSGLTRARAVRGDSKSIRERRSESRSGKSIAVDEPSNNPWAEAITPSDILVPPITVLGRRPTPAKSTPRSARSLQAADTPNSSRSFGQNTPTLAAPTSEPRGSTTPRPPNVPNRREAPTPPFSPDQFASVQSTSASPMIPPKSLPTPPPQSQRSGSSPRPISHILHAPFKDVGISAPLSPSRPSSSQSRSKQSPSNFTHEAIQRHNSFAQREAAASTDEERVRLFAEYIVSESRLRRDSYASAIDAMGSELLELTRDLFRPYPVIQKKASKSFSGERVHNLDRRRSNVNKLPTLQTNSPSDSTPSSASSTLSQGGPRPEPTWWNGYMPSLSPIASISASAQQDESSSRGRPSSRWWEIGQSGSGGSPTTKVERSKRESKYMGMPRELRESLQWEGNGQSSSPDAGSLSLAGPSTHSSYGTIDYPPEKVGWHEEGPKSPPYKTSAIGPAPYSPALITPNPRHLDVSRLVTLPPSYPRHHPAVNNNHPDLAEIRTSVRSLSDFTEVEANKKRFTTASDEALETSKEAASKRRSLLRSNIQRQISSGSMTYADAAKVEAESESSEGEIAKATSKADFELFQSSVIAPLNDLLMERINLTTSLFERLRSQLFVDAQQSDPNATQEEGDEQPELLEKLTLLKWIFEAREQMHRELYDLLSDRNNRYKVVVMTPYRLANNLGKIQNAELFFADDARKRQQEFNERALQRTIEFMDVIETNVVRGVEVQLSAFWDIAPALRQLTEKIPNPLTRDFQVQIPGGEYEDNPAYYTHPMQYLYSLLEHGRRSTYQFIESQTNLLCLLHEVKSAVTGARCRVMEVERVAAGEEKDKVEAEMLGQKEQEESRLTDDLKEKVRCVEELWESAVGGEFEGAKDRVRGFLVKEEGWEGMEVE